MSFASPSRALLLAAALAAPALAQGIPPTAPTQPAPVATSSQTPANQPAHRAQVDFTTGLLSITADNSSLNQILRDITRLTGIKITGGVNDERVFGAYGPADTSTVLTTLLRGTGSNLLIIFDARQQPRELVLTPRGGGPTPPNPSAGRERDEDDLPLQRMQQNGFNNTPPPQPPPPTDTTTQPSPNGVSTPEQIYQQLLKNQQQKQQRQPGATPTPPQ